MGDLTTVGDSSSPWHDTAASPGTRAEVLLQEMTLAEKVAQLGSARPTADTVIAAPGEDVFAAGQAGYEDATRNGIGQLTRVFGTTPVEPMAGAVRLAELQQDLATRTRLGIPAIAHEECLTGFTTYRATIFPTPLAWAATFDPDLVRQMGESIGAGMARAGVHQGLAPLLDVVTDYRWGRVEETMGEDPYVVGVIGAAYVEGLQTSGVVATLKHFAGYAASRAGRNNAPVSIGRRELEDVVLPPFEMAVREAGARSVMHAYNELDGTPCATNEWLLTEVLRDRWGFEGVVVSDYWGIPFLVTAHRVARDDQHAGVLALQAGMDVELPATRCFGPSLIDAVQAGAVPERMVDRAALRVLTQKAELGLLDSRPAALTAPAELDLGGGRDVARAVAERAIVLVANDHGVLPLAPSVSRVAVIGPGAADSSSLFGCYSFPRHVLERHPGLDDGVEARSVHAALQDAMPGAVVEHARGCDVDGDDRSGFEEAVRQASGADVCVLVVGDRAGLFGTGTSGEGCDVEDLTLPGVQLDLARAVLATGTPTVVVLLSGRPYALGDIASQCAAIVVSFFPGVEGGPALADVLVGRVSPSGRLPVQIPQRPGGGPGTYLHPVLGGRSDGISNLDPSPLFSFGHGLSYTTFEYSEVASSAPSMATDGSVEVVAEIENTGQREAAEVVQLYLCDQVAEVTRPVRQLIGFCRVELAPHGRSRVTFSVHADVLSFTGRDLQRVVEPGDVVFEVSSSSTHVRGTVTVELTGARRSVDGRRRMRVDASAIDVTAGRHQDGTPV